MDVVDADQARIAEEAGACAVMASSACPHIRRYGGVARMSDPQRIREIQDAVSIPVMAKCRIGHFAKRRLQALEVDYIDQSEVLLRRTSASRRQVAVHRAVRLRGYRPRRGAPAYLRGRGDDPHERRSRYG